MARASHNKVNCPVCDENVSCTSIATPGCPGSYFEPPEGPEIIEYGTPEYNCDCRDEIENNGGFVDTKYNHETKKIDHVAYNHLLAAYDKEVDRRVDESDFDIEFDEPDYDEDDFDQSND